MQISCVCPSYVSAFCNCEHKGISYALEAPFAAMLVEPVASPPLKWPPTTEYQIHKDLGNLTGDEQPLNHLRTWPRAIDEIGAKFKIYFKEKNVISNAYLLDYDLKPWTDNVKSKPDALYVTIHGWASSDTDSDITIMTSRLLLRNEILNVAVVNVDWSTAAQTDYSQSAAETVVIGNQVGLLLFKLVASNKIEAASIHLIGFDMGSLIASLAATIYSELAIKYNLKSGNQKHGTRIGRRTGFNPFARMFSGILIPNKIHDALFVDIIHTTTALSDSIGGSGIDILNRRFSESTLNMDVDELGHEIHFYPDGGQSYDICDLEDYGCSLN